MVRADKLYVHTRVQSQRIKIVVVADAGEHRDDNLQGARLATAGNTHAVFGINHQAGEIRQYASHRFAGALGQPVQPRLQQCNVAPEAVDNKPPCSGLLSGGEQFLSAHQLRKNSAPVDISDQ